MMNIKSLIGLGLVFLLQSTAFATQELDVNMDDKLDSYYLTHEGQRSGKVTVQSVFVEEPVANPVQITVTVKCFTGFRAKNSERIHSWQALDYGNKKNQSELSSFDAKKQELTVYFWTSKVSQQEGVQKDEARDKKFDFKQVCTHK